MHTGRGSDTDSRDLSGYDSRPANRVTQIGMIAKYITRNDLHIIDVDIRLVETVE